MPNEPETQTESLLFTDRIKHATAASHQRLEGLPLSRSIVSPTLDRVGYARYLGLMRDVVADTETVVFPLLTDVFTDLDHRIKRHHLEDDLRFVGQRTDPPRTVFTPDDIPSVAFAAGIFYVVEGSALGGRFILNNIRQTLGLDENGGATYFYGYGNATGQLWKRFLEQLNRFADESGHDEAIIAGADFAFNAIYRHFERHSR